MKPRKLLFVFVALTSICYAKGQTCIFLPNDDVTIDPISETITHNAGITDTDSILGLTLAYTPPLDLQDLKNITYIDVRQDVVNSQLVFELTAEFSNFDQNEANTHGADYTITQPLQLNCGQDVTMVFYLNVRDTNGHEPEFLLPPYEIVAALPLPPKFDLTALGDVIKATDIDFSNGNIIFELEPLGNFVVTTKPDPEDPLGKTYIAEIKVSRYTWLTGDQTFTLTATDSGETPKIATTEFKITIDKDSSAPDVQITFTQPSYTFDCTVDENNIPSLGAPDNLITFANPPQGDVSVDLSSAYFRARYDNGEVIIESTGTALGNSLKDVLILVLTAAPDSDPAATTNTVIVINLPSTVVVDVPKFSKPFYRVTYVVSPGDDLDVVDPNGETILVTEGANVQISTGQDFDVNFNIAGTGNDQWQITVLINLDQETLDKGGEIVLKLEATLTDAGTDNIDKGYSALIIELPAPKIVQIPKFSKHFYTATYVGNSTATDEVTVEDGPISITSDVDESLVIEIIDKYAENFQLDENYELNVLAPLSPETLQNEFEIVLTLRATLEGADSGFSTIVVNLPKSSLDAAPAFKNPWYRAEYKITDDGGPDTAEFVGDHISLIDGIQGTVHITIEDSPFSPNFEIVPEADDSLFRIDVVSNLVGDDLKEIDIVLTLIVTADASNEKSSGTLVITLPTQIAINPPKYSSLLYEATYEIVNTVPSVSLKYDQTISVNDGENNVVSVLPPYDVNFELMFHEEDNTYELSATEVLGDDTLTENIEIFVYLDAAADVVTVPRGTAIVAITLPEKTSINPPKYSMPLYEATYEIVENVPSVKLTVNETISVNDGENNVVSVLPPYDVNFELIFNQEDNTYELSPTEVLGGDTLTENIEIFVYLDAAADVVTVPHGTAIVAIKLPEKLTTVIPTFSEVHYQADYNIDSDPHTVSLRTHIQITSQQSTETHVVITGNFEENLKPTLDGDTWNIIVQQNLDDETLNNEKEIIVTLEASLSGDNNIGQATLIISLPTQDLMAAPRFTLPYYTADYSSDGILTTTSDDITISNPEAQSINVHLEGQYEQNFTLTPDPEHKTWILEVNEPLDLGSVIENEILLKVVGVLEGSAGDGFATLVIDLPAKETSVVTFNSAYYTAKYVVTEGSEQDELSFEDDNGNIAVSETVSNYDVTGAYTANFAFNCGEDGSCQLNVIQNLGADILGAESEIVIVLEAYEDENAKATATVVISLPLQDPEKTPKFTNVAYVANYKQNAGTDDDIATVENGPIKIEGDDLGAIKIQGENANFELQLDANSEWSISVKKDLTDEELKDNIILTLEAQFTDGFNIATAGLIIRKAESHQSDTLSFSQNVYVGDYVNGSLNVANLDQEIQIQNPSEDVTVSLVDGEFSAHFNDPTLNQDGIVTLTFKEGLSVPVLENSVITVKLLASDSTGDTTTEIVIKLPKTVAPASVNFEKSVYEADYVLGSDTENPSVSFADQIRIRTADNDFSSVEVALDAANPNAQYFDLEYIHDENVIVTLKPVGLPDTVLTGPSAVITVDIIATKTTVDSSNIASLVIKLPKTGNSATIYFTQNVYVGDYVEGSLVVANLDPEIQIQNPSADVTVSLVDGEFSALFNDPALNQDRIVTLTFKESLSVPVLENSVITVKLLASDPTGEATTEIVIKLPKTVAPALVNFEKSVYEADYVLGSDTEDPSVSFADQITIRTADNDFSSVVVALDDANPNTQYFNLEYNQDPNVIVTLKSEGLPDTVLTGPSAVIIVDIIATKTTDSTSNIASLVIKLPKTGNSGTFYFTQGFYLTSYIQDDVNTGHVEIPEPRIEIQGDLQNVNVELLGDNKDLFVRQYAAGIVTVTLKDTKLPDSVLKGDDAVIAVDIQAKKDAEEMTSTLVVKLPPKVFPTTIYFLKSVYVSTYLETGDNHIQIEDIIIGADDQTKLATLTVDQVGEFSNLFDVNYDNNGKVTVTLSDPLSDDVLNGQYTVISFDIQATDTTDNDITTTTVVVELPKIVIPTVIYFSDSVYVGEYLSEADNHLQLEGQIIILAKEPSLLTDVEVTLDDDKGQYFESSYAIDGNAVIVTVVLPNTLPEEILAGNSILSVTITATIGDGTDETVTATLVVKLPKTVVTTSISFPDVAYIATYSEDDESLEVEGEITIEGEGLDQTVVALEGVYAGHFESNYDTTTGKITITLKDDIPDDVVEANQIITVTIRATKGLETVRAPLVVKLPRAQGGGSGGKDKDDDNSAFIAVIAVLAVLLVGALVGSAFFYYKKMRNNNSRAPLIEEEDFGERFKKNSAAVDTKKFEHPTRRPTGYVKYPLNGTTGSNEETTTDVEEPERRKSVAFNDSVEELEIESGENDYEKVNNFAESNTDGDVEERTNL